MKSLLISLVLLLTLAFPARAIDVEYVDQFPQAEDFIETDRSGGFCKDGRVYGIILYEHETEFNIAYSEYYLHPDTETPKVVTFIEIDSETDEVFYDIYIHNQGKFERFRSVSAFQKVYPKGVCNSRVDQQDL